MKNETSFLKANTKEVIEQHLVKKRKIVSSLVMAMLILSSFVGIISPVVGFPCHKENDVPTLDRNEGQSGLPVLKAFEGNRERNNAEIIKSAVVHKSKNNLASIFHKTDIMSFPLNSFSFEDCKNRHCPEDMILKTDNISIPDNAKEHLEPSILKLFNGNCKKNNIAMIKSANEYESNNDQSVIFHGIDSNFVLRPPNFEDNDNREYFKNINKPGSGKGVAAEELSSTDIVALQEQGEIEGWTFTVGENSATDYLLDDLCGLVEPEDWWVDACFDPCVPLRDLPVLFDWRTLGGCTPVKNQGSCGSCWAFGTVGPLESAILINDGATVDLSEQWLVSCNSDDWGCDDGGWWAHDYHQWKTDCCGGTGAVLETVFPYVAYDAPCNCPYSHAYTIGSWAFIGNDHSVPSVNAIKQAIVDYGPVSAAVSTNSAFHCYTGGVFNNHSEGTINHAIVLVGWDDSQGTDGVWFLRNSWGTGWGENGYMRIEYGCSNVGYAACYVDYQGDKPNENATICGYVSDSVTDLPIQNAVVSAYWWDDQNHKYGNSTNTDSSGFYSMNVSAAEIHLDVCAGGYFQPDTCICDIEDNEVLWLNISLISIPPENSVIYGYVTNELTDDPIEDAWIYLSWHDNQDHWDWNYTYTDSSGFYSMNVAAGEIYLYVDADGYCSGFSGTCVIGECETLEINISLYPRPPENATVCGYVTDEETGIPIEDAEIQLRWKDDLDHYYYNYTYTDYFGFYAINAAAGQNRISVYANGYFDEYTGYHDIEEDETLWLNISMVSRPPENSIVCGYVNDSETGLPIEDAYVDLDWRDNSDHYDWNGTYTDSSGFYSMNVAAGEFDLYVYADGYFGESTGYYNYEIGEYETLTINVSLWPKPPENSVVCGYVTDEETGIPIEDAEIQLRWKDDLDHYYYNYTYTDYFGFYAINAAAGQNQISASANGYYFNNTDYFMVNDYDTLLVNVSLQSKPPENSVVCGYVTDEVTGLPVEDAYVDLDWHDNQDHWYWNYTYTDSSGFYSMNVAAGEIYLYIYADEYFYNYLGPYEIGEFETLWVNVSMVSRPPKNSIVCGYVNDSETGLPIEDAYVDLDWRDNSDHYDWNGTYTDSSGFYSMNVAAGEFSLYVSAGQGYISGYTEWSTIGENESLWLNFTLEKDDILPTISNLIIPEYVGQNHPGNISANISDKNLQCVYILLFDCYNITYNQSFVMWYYLDDTGINDTYAIKNYSGTYANLKQGINSTPTTILTLSNSAETKKIYTLAYFKKNQTSSWAQIVLEFNLSNGILDNIATISMSPNGTMELDYITSMIESGVSLVTPLSIYLDGGNSLWINYTLYTIGSSGNPYLNWSKLNNGEYGGIVMASDKASNVNSTTFNLTVSHDFYNISGTVFYNGTETGAIDIALFDEYIGEGSEPIAWTSISSPGNYTFEVINGTYYLGAYMDINGNGYCDEEPLGFAINKTFGQQIDEIIVNGSNMDGIDITLYELPDTVYVDDDYNNSTLGWGYDHFDSIQDGIDAVCENGTVYVFNGTYFENVTIDKTINLVGEDTLTTTIESLIPVSTVIIMADNVTMKNFSIGSSSCGDIGIRVLSCKNLQIGCCNIDSSGEAGIELESDCENVLIFNCSATTSSCGIYVHEANNIVVMNCNLSNNQLNGLRISDSYQIQVRDSMVSLNDEHGIFLFNSSEFNVSDCVIRDNDWAGIRFNYSSNSTIQDCEVFGSTSGIYFDESSNNTIFDCFIYNNTQNIHLNNANYDNVLRNLNIMGGQVGVQLYTSSTNEITNCSVSNNEYGIFFGGFSLFSASNNVISGCNIFNNDYGVMIESSKNNNVFYNNYFNNTNNAIDNGTNIWNISKIIGMNIIGGNWLGGNYWSDYTGIDTDGDGIGDTELPYNCSGNIQNGGDWLPLILPSGPNDSPVIFGESPVNGSTSINRPPSELNATVEDPDSNTMDVFIRWEKHDYYHFGEWGTLGSYTGVGNGTYNTTNLTGNDWIWGNTIYTWSVNVTDGTFWTNETYHYTTGGSRYDVSNNDVVNFQDAGLVWIHRTSEVDYDGIYDVNQNGVVNFQDAGLTWVNRD